MTGLDTNILVRFFTKDDLEQGSRATKLLRSLTAESPGFISIVSLIELVWVLRSHYGLDKAKIVLCVERLLDSLELVLESQSAVTQALQRFAGAKVDLADCLIERCGHLAGCLHTFTFDVNASKSAGMMLL